MTIGRWPAWSTTAARERAKDLRRETDAGADPLSQKELDRDGPRVTDMIARYIDVHLPNLSPNNASDQKSAVRFFDVTAAPNASPESNLEDLIDIAAGAQHPVVIGDDGVLVGAITKDRLLVTIKEGK